MKRTFAGRRRFKKGVFRHVYLHSVAETRVTGADDMCRFLEERPGAYFMLGAAKAAADGVVYAHHHPKFDFDEACIPLGIELALRIVEEASGSRIA